MEKVTVQVLLSAYNGAEYLIRQLDSILLQAGVELSLLVRDDGSSDRTLEILRAYEKRYPNVSVYAGDRKGAAESFYDLLRHADLSKRYFAFADQDDVWHRDKLLRAVLRLEQDPSDRPALYASSVVYASKNLRDRRNVTSLVRRSPSFGNALMENICMGCTQVFNLRLLELVRGHLMHGSVWHDWWMYLTAAYFGTVIFDPRPSILYRQHGKNAVGMQDCRGKRWISRIRRIRQMKHSLSEQACLFKDTYADLLQADARLELLCGYRTDLWKKCSLIRSRAVYRQNALDDAVCRILFLFGFL